MNLRHFIFYLGYDLAQQASDTLLLLEMLVGTNALAYWTITQVTKKYSISNVHPELIQIF
jgi:hypothetical protein